MLLVFALDEGLLVPSSEGTTSTSPITVGGEAATSRTGDAPSELARC
jgi:hypothetical protein